MFEIFWKPVYLLICLFEAVFIIGDVNKPRFLSLLYQWSSRSWTKWNSVGNPLFFKKQSFLGKPRNHNSIGILVVKSLKRRESIGIYSSILCSNLRGISSCLIHSIRNMNTFSFSKLEVHFSKLRCFMTNTRTIGISYEVCCVDTMTLGALDRVLIILRKWRVVL